MYSAAVWNDPTRRPDSSMVALRLLLHAEVFFYASTCWPVRSQRPDRFGP